MPPFDDPLSSITRTSDTKALPPHVVVWEPIPDSSQALALDSRADHTLYTGSRGPGKTDTQLMRFGIPVSSKVAAGFSNRKVITNGFGILAKSCYFVSLKRSLIMITIMVTNTRSLDGTN
jgi:hypothetical protein